MADDLYAVLGVDRSASQAEIHTAYRRLAQARHPDHAAGSEPEMVVLNLAYGVLGDPERRRRYDASLAVAADEAPIWADDLEEHADDWRQMFEEERKMWEQLLAAQPWLEPSPGRASIEAALAQTRQAQLELENAIRARFSNLAPLSPETFEAERAAALAHTPRPANGCLTLLLLGLASRFPRP